MDKVGKLGGDGGIIAIDKNGNINFEMNTAGMYRASIDKKEKLYIAIYKEE
jgi:beta-aspartyl-peptidase (threonine type)